jgi:hypothetical protein
VVNQEFELEARQGSPSQFPDWMSQLSREEGAERILQERPAPPGLIRSSEVGGLVESGGRHHKPYFFAYSS